MQQLGIPPEFLDGDANYNGAEVALQVYQQLCWRERTAFSRAVRPFIDRGMDDALIAADDARCYASGDDWGEYPDWSPSSPRYVP